MSETFTYDNVLVEKNHPDGVTEEWTAECDIHLDGTTYRISRLLVEGASRFDCISIVRDGVDFTETDLWPDGEVPHVVEVLGQCRDVVDAEGKVKYTYWEFERLIAWVDETFFHPVWTAIEEAESAIFGSLGQRIGAVDVTAWDAEEGIL